ncbi:MAG: hypothetical protein QM817_04105 [Archangium sp.]
MRALVLGLIVVSGCQCLVPVAEDGGVLTDAGRGGGGGSATGGGGSTGGGSATGGGGTTGGGGATGGGGSTGGGAAVDAGSGCTTPADCTGTVPPVVTQCGGATGAWSCAFGHCVAECGTGRTCTAPDAGCLDCGSGTECLRPNNCPMTANFTIETSTCGLPQFERLTATSISSLPCTYIVSWSDGGVLGSMSFYGFDDLSANIPSLGGGCVGQQLPTGAIRYSVSCPNCMMSVMP